MNNTAGFRKFTEKENTLADSAVFNVTFFAILLFLLSSIVRLGSSLYTPALTLIGEDLGISEALLSFSLTAYFAGFAVATLFVGPAADAFGRRMVIFGGVLVFIGGTITCGTAEGGTSLITGRLLQALGASAIPVTSRAMIRDACDDKQVISVLGWMGALGGFVPILAPALGGLITQTLGWRFNFWMLLVVCLVISSISVVSLPETLSFEKRHKFHVKNILSRYKEMIVAPELILVVAPLAFCFAIQGAYITASPFIFITDFHLTPIKFGLTNFFLVGALIMGRTICTRMLKKYSLYIAYMTGAAITFVSGITFLGVYLFDYFNLVSLIVCSMFFGMGFGALLPIGLKSVMTAFKHQSGTVSALYGSFTLGASAIGSALIGFMIKHGVSEFAALSRFAFGASLLVLVFASFTKKRLI